MTGRSTLDLQPEGHSNTDVNNTRGHLQDNGQTQTTDQMSWCSRAALRYSRCPLLATTHPLPENPKLLRTCAQGFLCPPSGKVAAVLFVVLMFALWWATLLSIAWKEVMPDGNLFPMLVLFISAWCGGYLTSYTPLPPLLGMLVVGVILGNVEGINVARQIQSSWSSTARSIALTVILLRAGLGLDPAALKRLSFVVPRLAFCPSVVEVIVDGVAAHFVLDFPWTWAFMLGFVLAVVSPAVVVPSMLSLSERRYGLDKGVPTLIIAACSLDSVLAVTGFGVLLGISFSTGDTTLLLCILNRGPLDYSVPVYRTFPVWLAVSSWFIPQKNLTLFRCVMLVGGGLLAVFGSKITNWSGSGPLGCLSLAFVANYRWRRDYSGDSPVEVTAGVLWMLFMPLLFGLIGAAVDISSLEARAVGEGVGVLMAGLCARVLVAWLTMLKTDLNMKERFFVPIAWIPKATVQAAIGAVAYDTAVERGATDLIPLGKKILMQAVLAILIAAPLGSALIALAGPRLLHKTDDVKNTKNKLFATLDNGHVNDAIVTGDETGDGCTATKL
ncbi:unnamed protein product [Lymnaea stagnalis]|uniref:Cation/H+ exchanger transmembrane domain-containing protein n=1 Tax=Lymnaea stagnalis TaxID=6523 RepID=A0AAV2IEV6_LYMST